MPELPEVQTTVDGINTELKGLTISDVWTDYNSLFHANKQNIKNPEYFTQFKKDLIGAKIVNATRKGKNVLIHLSNKKTILIHMKMTGHLMYGKYEFNGKEWIPAPDASEALKDPFNRFIHLLISFTNKNHAAFSDMRKFAKVFIFETKNEHEVLDLMHIGPDPLSKEYTYTLFKERIMKKPTGKIKLVLMDQELIAGIGNIYSDEILWDIGVHPESAPKRIPEVLLKKMYESSKNLLRRGIDFGGDSTSDYRNIYGEAGKFQYRHNTYRRTGETCPKKGCKGTILRKPMGGRSAHFCDTHQKKYS